MSAQRQNKLIRFLTIGIFVLLLSFFYHPNRANAYEYNGITLELMNGNSTVFYGLGIFTSDRRFTAGITALIPTAMFSKDAADSDRTPDTRLSNRSYPFYSLSFYGNYNFIRTSRTVYFVGFGIQPLIPTKYVYNYTFGVEYFQSEAVRFYFAFKNIYTNYVTDSQGRSSHLNRIADGPQFLFGLKFAFLGKKRVKTKRVAFRAKTSKKKRAVKRTGR